MIRFALEREDSRRKHLRLVGAGVVKGWVGTLASPRGGWGVSLKGNRTRATQASPLHHHSTPAPTERYHFGAINWGHEMVNSQKSGVGRLGSLAPRER